MIAAEISVHLRSLTIFFVKPFKRIQKNRGGFLIISAVLCALAVLLPSGFAPAAELRFVVSDLWVKDTETGLMWSRDGNPAGRLMSWDDAEEYIGTLNAQKYAGHNDWKLPDIDEMRKFVSAVREAASVNAFSGDVTVAWVLKRLGFYNVQADDYWTSTTSIYYDLEAWHQSMKYGGRAAGNKSLYLYAWPVRWEE